MTTVLPIDAQVCHRNHAQLSFYRDALEHRGPCYLIAVETVAPYAVTVMHLTERALLEGDKLNRMWLERLAQCEAAVKSMSENF